MKRTILVGLGLGLLGLIVNVAPAPIAAAEEGAQSVTTGLTSTKDHGVVSIVADPTLSDGRLVLKVVAFNRTKMMSAFGPEDVKVFTASGQPVALMTVEQLVAQVRGGADGSSDRTTGYNPSAYSGPITTNKAYGQPDVGNYTGGAHVMGGIEATPSRPREDAKRHQDDDPKVQQQIDALNAAILHSLTIAPATAAGGQIVTEKMKFGRKEERALRVTVDYNGETHEFNFAAPPAK